MFLKFLVSMSKKVSIYLNNILVSDDAKLQSTFFERLFGLMFSKNPAGEKILVFKNAPWIHSFFCFFRFDAVFLDDNFCVTAYKSNIPPFLILKPVLNSAYTLELVNTSFDIKIGDKMYINEH